MIEWRERALCASLARVHPILVAARARDRMPLIHRHAAKAQAKGRTHDSTLARNGQLARGDVDLALHDESASVNR